MPTPCHACPEAAGPSGWCARHRNRLNAIVGSKIMKAAPLSDLIAVAQHPGWRGRKWRLTPQMWKDGLFFHVDTQDGIGPGYRTASEALAEIDRHNGPPTASDLDALRAKLAEAEAARDAHKAERDEARRALVDVQSIIAGVPWGDPATLSSLTLGPETVSKAADIRRRLTAAERERDDARKALAEAEAERDDAHAALTDARAIAAGLLPAPPPSVEPPATLGESTVATVAALRRDKEEVRRLLREENKARISACEERDACAEELRTLEEALGVVVRHEVPPGRTDPQWVASSALEEVDRWADTRIEAVATAVRGGITAAVHTRAALASVKQTRDNHLAARNKAEAHAKRWANVAVVLGCALVPVWVWLLFVTLVWLRALTDTIGGGM